MTYTEWEFSNAEVTEFAKVDDGLQYMNIEDAVYDADQGRLYIFWRSLKNNADFRETFFMKTKTGANNGHSIRLLREMGAAGYGVPVEEGVPAPADLIGLTLLVNVANEPDKKDPTKTYAHTKEYYPLQEADLDTVNHREDQFYQIAQ